MTRWNGIIINFSEMYKIQQNLVQHCICCEAADSCQESCCYPHVFLYRQVIVPFKVNSQKINETPLRLKLSVFDQRVRVWTPLA